MIIKPQRGFQENFLRSNADIIIGGSGAGVGKTFAALLQPLYHVNNNRFGTVIFRKTYSQITNTGAIWDASKSIYSYLGAKPNESEMQWTFPSGATVKFSHLQHDKNIYDHQGAEYPYIIFDELTHFSEQSFWYLSSRNRSTCGVKPRMFATCNPDPDSFVAKLIEWYIDQSTGYAIAERCGKLRYFIRLQDAMAWGDSKQEVIDMCPEVVQMAKDADTQPEELIKSFTFIQGSIYDNKELLKVNPSYLSNLLAQDEQEKQRLLFGNWKVRQDKSSLFDFDKIGDVFSNYVASGVTKYITCDAARFGRDLCVILVWKGWEVIHIEVMKQSDVHDIISAIEALRKKFGISKSSTLIDQDGVGSGTVRQGQYKGFSGGDTARKVQGGKENYKNLKTQCYYYLAEKVNTGDIRVHVNNENCVIDGVRSSKIKVGGKIQDVQELIRDDLRAIKRENIDMDGKYQINDKSEQKVILGRSPDFGDSMMMRSVFELMPKSQYL